MRTWQLAHGRRTCGLCGVSIAVGTPLQLITKIGVARVLYRCPACADGIPPDSLPTLPEKPTETRLQPTNDVMRIGEWLRDHKLLQAGEREPGQEG